MPNNIVKYEQLREIAGDLWDKAKKRDITALEYDEATKTIKGKNPDNQSLAISAKLTNLVAINERAKFQQDVSVDKAGSVNNLNIGRLNGAANRNRFSGCRGITSKSFVDGYISYLSVFVDPTLNVNDQTAWQVWAIKKGRTKTDDVVFKAYHTTGNVQATVEECTINNSTYKCAKIVINEEFADEVYFIVQCIGKEVMVITDIPTEHAGDVVNLSLAPPTTQNSPIQWTGYNAPDNMLALRLVGRESITSLAEKLRQTQADGSKYVLQSETTNTGGSNQYAGKVVKLGDDGKVNANMLPSIAINEYIPATAFTHDALRQLEFQNGDIVVVTANGKVTRYLCVDKAGHTSDLRGAFVPLNDKDGIVFSVNGQTPGANGDVTVRAEHIKYTNGQNTTVKEELDKKISNIALKTGDNKQLTITKADNTTSDVNLTEAFKADNISYSGQIGGATKNNVKEAIDALKDEANKGIKSIKGGRPNANGELDVTVNTTGNGITMTFGTTGGTPVQIATYMTADEVNQIKALFV